MSQVKSDPASNTFVHKNEAYINLLNEICGFEFGENANYGAVGMSLHNVRNLLFDEQTVSNAIEKAIIASTDFSPTSITESFVSIYPELVQPLLTTSEIESVEEEPEQELYYQYSTFCSHTLPQTETQTTEAVTEYTNNKLSISCIKGLPYGGIPRMIILYVNSMAVKYRTREIDIGRSVKEFVERLGYTSSYIENGINQQVLVQLEKLFYTTYVHSTMVKTVTASDEHIIEKKDTRIHLFDSTMTWEHVRNNLTENAVAKVILSENYFNEILAHPVPLSLDAIRALKKSPLALDLYAFISYRANTRRLVPAKLEDLKKQFCYDAETWRFKAAVLRSLKYIDKVWPECNVMIKGDVLLIPKMATHISKQP